MAKHAEGRAHTRRKGNLVDDIISKPYELNVQKSLAKKLEATKRKNIEYRYTDGGVTGQADAVTFELLKEALLVYFGAEKKDYKCKITESKDRDGNCVQKTIRVVYPNQTDSYTLNLYYTKCSFLVNGKSVEKFLYEDLKKIHLLIESATVDGEQVDITELNALLAKQLSEVLSINNKQQNTTAITESDSVEHQKSIKCIKCGKNCQSRAAFCEKTFHWIHYRCDKLSAETVHKIENDTIYKYECQVCTEVSIDKNRGTIVSRGKQKVTGGGRSNDSMQVASLLSNEIDLIESSLTDESHETGTKTIAESILEEELSLKICYNCEGEIQDSEAMPCEICNGECHLSCLADTEGGMTCKACKSSQLQINEPEKVGSVGTSKKKETECNASEISESDRKLSTETVYNSLENCISQTYSAENQNRGCQTESGSLVDLQKRLKELNLREKAINKKEFELSQTSKQLITARTKIITLEKTVNELQKENDLLRTNLLLLQTNPGKKEEEGDRQTHFKQQCAASCSNIVLEQRISALEHEQLKSRIERLELNITSRNVRVQEHSHINENAVTGKLSKLIEVQQEMILSVQNAINSQNHHINRDIPKQCESPETLLKPIDLSQKKLNGGESVRSKDQLGEPQPTVVIIEDDVQSPVKESKTESQTSDQDWRKRTPSVGAVEGAPIQYYAQTVPPTHPFLYPAWNHHVPPWMGQQRRAPVLINNRNMGPRQRDMGQSWRTQRETRK